MQTFVGSQALSGLEIGGLLTGITGATVISTGDLIIKKVKEMRSH
jgi:hypothetical protein